MERYKTLFENGLMDGIHRTNKSSNLNDKEKYVYNSGYSLGLSGDYDDIEHSQIINLFEKFFPTEIRKEKIKSIIDSNSSQT